MHPAKFWHTISDHSIQCTLCPHNCILREGKSGICNTRINIKNELYSLVYGFPAAINIDPIEKKPLYHFLPGSKVFSIGTEGCNLKCTFCQNWSLSQEKPQPNAKQYISPSQITDLAEKYQCDSIAFTYNEPVIFAEYIMDISKEAHQRGIKTVMVTNGFMNNEHIEEIYRYIDAANVDLKSFSNDFYKKMTGATLQPVLNTIKTLKRMNIWIEITNLIIPGVNDNLSEFENLCSWIMENTGSETPLHITAFHPDYKYFDSTPTSPDQIIQLREVALRIGLKFVYTGNIRNYEGSTTYCPNCGNEVVQRFYSDTKVNLDTEHKCSCGTIIDGVF